VGYCLFTMLYRNTVVSYTCVCVCVCGLQGLGISVGALHPFQIHRRRRRCGVLSFTDDSLKRFLTYHGASFGLFVLKAAERLELFGQSA